MRARRLVEDPPDLLEQPRRSEGLGDQITLAGDDSVLDQGLVGESRHEEHSKIGADLHGPLRDLGARGP
ncbi:MAG: hypothetical protein ACX98W_08005, partial [bacterium]